MFSASVCLLVFASTLIMCTLHTLLSCDFPFLDGCLELRAQDTMEQRQHRRESGNTRSEQLLMLPIKQLTNYEWLPGEPLNGSECLKARVYLSIILLATLVNHKYLIHQCLQ